MSDHEYGLVMPFVVCASQGGPYNDDAYVAGYETGALDAKLHYERPDLLQVTVHTDNVPQLDLVAMRHGYDVDSTTTVRDGWTIIELRRVALP